MLLESVSSAEPEITDFEFFLKQKASAAQLLHCKPRWANAILEAANSIANRLGTGHQLTLLNVVFLIILYKALIRATWENNTIRLVQMA